MTVRDSRRQAALERMADHVLDAGLHAASLRPLAVAAGTSNRMLLYYFANKEELVAATLARIAERLTLLLDAQWPPARRAKSDVLLRAMWKAMQSPKLKPYMQLWLEITARAARLEEPIRTIAGQIAAGFLAWAATRLDVEHERHRAAEAALWLATLEGLLVLDAVGAQKIARTALNKPKT